MQKSNLSAIIFPNIKEDWLLFIEKTSNELQDMISKYNNDKRRVRDLDRIINKIKEIKELSRDNIEEILNYKELFMYIDNSLESSFDALMFFKNNDNFDNEAVHTIYERIVNSPKIMKINSEYNSLAIRIQFDKERIRKLGELIRGSKVDYALIKELIEKYKLSDEKKKNILFYPVVMLSVKQNEIQNTKESSDRKKEEKDKFYRNQFNELCKVFQNAKDKYKDLLIHCFDIREKMNHSEIDMYKGLANNPDEIDGYGFDEDINFKIYTVSLFKIKRDIENFINGISDLIVDENDLDYNLAFFNALIEEFEMIANKLKSLSKEESKDDDDEPENNVFFALDPFNRLLIKEELLSTRNRASIKALIEKASSTNNSKIDGLRTSHMLGVSDAERILGKNISLLVTSRLFLAYIMVDKNVLIIAGETNNITGFDKIVNRIVERNAVSLRRQIELISENNLDYLDLQNRIIKNITGEEEKEKLM